MSAARILLIEDTPSQAELALAQLRALGYEVRHAATGSEALAIAQGWQPEVALVDLGLPDMAGFAVMERLDGPAMVVLTAQGSVATAVEAMKRGAGDFIVKPWKRERLHATIESELEKRRLRVELRAAKEALNPSRFGPFIGASAAMQAVYRTVQAVAASKASVFVTGESGTGKELAAEALHGASPRAKGPFVALNCGAIPKDLLEAEIFGVVKGAFTGAGESRDGAAQRAHRGTLFLDEIGEMPMDAQVKLLRFIQTGVAQPVGGGEGRRLDVRFVAATNRDIEAEVAEGRFREDLFWRLYVVPVELPPLRGRGADGVLLARHFLAAFAKEEGKAFRRLSPEAEAAIQANPWPGNVRQLQNALRNAVVLHDGEVLEAAMLPAALMRGAAPEARPAGTAPVAAPAVEPLAALEKRAILHALEVTGQDVAAAARLLEVNPSTIYRKLQAWKGQAT
ncbi:sigma-54-dependent transcriptional regulator [Roseococcus sp. DSY-14]|uniref:sigma-54-dependent transcriptional regulator n=1 Tax=Roseococcus sp. DSY-14 TaxID=3369650 RepID=UPI00387B9C59